MIHRSPVRAAANARNLVGPVIRAMYRISVTGAHHLPRSGPALIVGECPEAFAGAVLKSIAVRPVHVLAPRSASYAPAATGDVIVDAPGVDATRVALGLLEGGAAIAVLSPGVLAAYLACVSGAPVVPVVISGAAGRVAADPPPLRRRIDVRMSAARHLASPTGSCSSVAVRDVAEQLRQALADASDEARARRGEEVNA